MLSMQKKPKANYQASTTWFPREASSKKKIYSNPHWHYYIFED